MLDEQEFQVGDKVFFIDNEGNREFNLNVTDVFTIDWISYTDGMMVDIFLVEDKNSPYYHKQFRLDAMWDRNRKLLKLKEKIYVKRTEV